MEIENAREAIVENVADNSCTLPDLIVLLGDYLSSSDDMIRSRGVEVLADVLSRLPNLSLTAGQVTHLCEFFTARLLDNSSFASIARALISLSRHHVNSLAGATHLVSANGQRSHVVQHVLRGIFEEVNIPTQVQEVRSLYLEFILTCVQPSSPLRAAIDDMGSDFVYGALQAIDGERDPRNLLMTFEIVRRVVGGDALDIASLGSSLPVPGFERFTEEVFEVIACYFPIVFRQKPADPDAVTPAQLRFSVLRAMSATNSFAAIAVPFLLDKLEEPLAANQRADCLDAVGVLCRAYDASAWSSFSVRIFRTLHREAARSLSTRTDLHVPYSVPFFLATPLSRDISAIAEGEGDSNEQEIPEAGRAALRSLRSVIWALSQQDTGDLSAMRRAVTAAARTALRQMCILLPDSSNASASEDDEAVSLSADDIHYRIVERRIYDAASASYSICSVAQSSHLGCCTVLRHMIQKIVDKLGSATLELELPESVSVEHFRRDMLCFLSLLIRSSQNVTPMIAKAPVMHPMFPYILTLRKLAGLHLLPSSSPSADEKLGVHHIAAAMLSALLCAHQLTSKMTVEPLVTDDDARDDFSRLCSLLINALRDVTEARNLPWRVDQHVVSDLSAADGAFNAADLHFWDVRSASVESNSSVLGRDAGFYLDVVCAQSQWRGIEKRLHLCSNSIVQTLTLELSGSNSASTNACVLFALAQLARHFPSEASQCVATVALAASKSLGKVTKCIFSSDDALNALSFALEQCTAFISEECYVCIISLFQCAVDRCGEPPVAVLPLKSAAALRRIVYVTCRSSEKACSAAREHFSRLLQVKDDNESRIQLLCVLGSSVLESCGEESVARSLPSLWRQVAQMVVTTESTRLGQFLGALISRAPVTLKSDVASFLAEVVSVMGCDFTASRAADCSAAVRCVDALIWCAKAAIQNRTASTACVNEFLLNTIVNDLLLRPTVSASVRQRVAHGCGLLLRDVPVSLLHCSRVLYKQKHFEMIAPSLLAAVKDPSMSAVSADALLAIGLMLPHLPPVALQQRKSDVLPLLMLAIRLETQHSDRVQPLNNSFALSALASLSALVEGADADYQLIAERVLNLVPALLDLVVKCDGPSKRRVMSAKVRCAALNLLHDLAVVLPYHALFPVQKDVQRRLKIALDDPKRVVRQCAARARNLYFTLK